MNLQLAKLLFFQHLCTPHRCCHTYLKLSMVALYRRPKLEKIVGDLVSATTYSVDNIASNNVTYTMIKCKLSEFQLRRYNLEKKRQKSKIMNLKGKKEKQGSLLRALCALHYAANHVGLLPKDRIKREVYGGVHNGSLVVWPIKVDEGIDFFRRKKNCQ